MKFITTRLFAAAVAFLSIPFIYNSCQGGLLGGSGFSSSKMTCKATLINGKVETTLINRALPPGPFSVSKVKLRADLDSRTVAAKTTGPIPISSGSKLSVLIDNDCAAENNNRLDETVITKSVLGSAEPIVGLDRQAYEWSIDRDFTDLEIEQLANREGCVVGVSWNKEYKIQATTFNDSSLYEQSNYLNAIRANLAYDSFYHATGGMVREGNMANSTVVAVIDTGVDWQHADLVSNMWAHQNGMGIDITTFCANCGPVNYNPFDISSIGHGTHVAGIIAAVANNGMGIAGVMPFRSRIMAIKVFSLNSQGELTTTSQHFANAVRFAYLNGAKVINLSLGAITSGPASDAQAQAAIADAIQNKAVVIAVIGNADGGGQGAEVNGTTLSSIPGQYATIPGVIGVGSFDAVTGLKSSFSHYSQVYAEIGAPGSEQSSSGLYSLKPRNVGAYGRLAGTSQAAPIVAAAAALTIGIIKEKYQVPPDPAEVEDLILSSAVKSSQLAPYFKQGNRLDLASLAEAIKVRYPLTRGGGGSTNLNPSGCR